MTFDPSSDLAKGASYTRRWTASATDIALVARSPHSSSSDRQSAGAGARALRSLSGPADYANPLEDLHAGTTWPRR
jgi:hypothetical protein